METSQLTRTDQPTPESVFAPVADRPGSVWLDSSMHFGDRGRRSFIAVDPQLDVGLDGDRVVVTSRDRRIDMYPGARIWDLLLSLWEDRRYFSVGYIAYEATLPFLGLVSERRSTIPSVRFLFYGSVRCFDHECQGQFEYLDDPDLRCDLWLSGAPHRTTRNGRIWRMTTERKDYLERVRAIKHSIREGDIYQANFTTRIDVRSDEPPFDVYCRLRRLNPAPDGAYLNFGAYQGLSSSPERMFTRQGRHIRTGPIKGTIAGGHDPAQTDRNRRRLVQSEKNRAELLMIVDLERNDLGRIARPGTVKVDRLFGTETYSSVIHLVSDISAELTPEVSLTDILFAMLPGGSITGAPKKRAVEIIEQLENTPRSIYTGCIGYVHGDEADFNIAIRTMTRADSVYRIHAGGGIVADSEPEAEYREMLLKARNLLRAVGAGGDPSLC